MFWAAVLRKHVAALGVLAVSADPGRLEVVFEGVEGAGQHRGARVRPQGLQGFPERGLKVKIVRVEFELLHVQVDSVDTGGREPGLG